MSDFHQSASLDTLHKLGDRSLADLETELTSFAHRRPLALIIPCSHADLIQVSLNRILNVLRHVTYPRLLVISVDGANHKQAAAARKVVPSLPFEVKLLWNQGPALIQLLQQISESSGVISAGMQCGKGQACWVAIGYVLQRNDIEVVAIHDADIKTYSREMLARLCYPVLHPESHYAFCKGFYARFSECIFGRVTRLLMFPLLHSILRVLPDCDFVKFLSEFRYPLAGEIAASTKLLESVSVQSGWGVDIGLLSQVYGKVGARHVCQSELSHRYDHKHQLLSARNPNCGLHRMSVDVIRVILDSIASCGTGISASQLEDLEKLYTISANRSIELTRFNAQLNGMAFDHNSESEAVTTFASALRRSIKMFRQGQRTSALPSWGAVTQQRPRILDSLRKAIDDDSDQIDAEFTRTADIGG